jgi:uncharacterized membrane protein
MEDKLKTKREEIRIGGKLKEVFIVKDAKGNILHKIISPLMVEFYPRDFVQIIVGASILAIPIAFTSETWDLGKMLGMNKVIGIGLLSLFFIAIFVYYNFYRGKFKKHYFHFFKRVISTYILSILVVALILTLIEKAPWSSDYLLAIKRVILVAFPASMSAAVADMIK